MKLITNRNKLVKQTIVGLSLSVLFAACQSGEKKELDTNKTVVPVDTTSLYNSNTRTDTARNVTTVTAAPAPVTTVKTVTHTTKAVTPVKTTTPVVVKPATTSTTTTSTGTTTTSGTGTTAAPGTTTTTTTTTPEPAKKKGWSEAAKDATIGGVAGAVGGAVISKNKGKGAIIGGVLGGVGGYILGRSKDKKSGRVGGVDTTK